MLNTTRSSRKHTWKYLLIVPALTIITGLLSAATPPPDAVNGLLTTDSLYKKRFPGGAEAFTQFIAKNIHYPREAQVAYATGAVTAQFQLAPDGSVKGVKVINGAREDLGQEVERLLNTLPEFEAVPSGKTDTILFTVVFLMVGENGKHIGPPGKEKADLYVTGYGVQRKQE
jgi:hypothetical protein